MRSALALAALALGCSSPVERGAPVREREPLKVTRGPLEKRIMLTGELEAVQSIKLSPPATDSGRLTVQWLAEDGSAVKKGDRLVEFDNSGMAESLRELELQEQQAQNTLISSRAQATITREEKQIEVERQRVAVAEAKLDARIPQTMISRRDWQQYQLALSQAQTALKTAEDELEAQKEAAAHEERVNQIALDKIRRKIARMKRQLDELVLRAPRDGILVIADHPWHGRKFQVGDNVWPSITVAKVPDLSEMRVKAGLSDVDDGRIAVGMKATCVLDARPDQRFDCEVTSVSPVAREPSEESQRRFFDVKLGLRQTDPKVMRPGMSVRVEVLARRTEGAVIAPRAGLDLSGEKARALLGGGGSKEVAIGFCTPRACTIDSGLEEGATLRRAWEAQ